MLSSLSCLQITYGLIYISGVCAVPEQTVTLQSHHFFHLLSCSADDLAHTFILSVITFKYFKSTPKFVFHFHAIFQSLMICHKDFFQHHKCNILMHHEWKWKVKVKSLSLVQLSVTPWTVAYHAPLSMGFSRQEYFSRWSSRPGDRTQVYHIVDRHSTIWATAEVLMNEKISKMFYSL